MCHAYAQTVEVIDSTFARCPAGLSPFASVHTDSILTPAALMSHSHTLRMSCAEWHTFISPTTKNTDQGLGDSEVWKQGHPGIVLPKGFRYSVSWQPAMLSQKQCYLTWLFNHNRAKLYCLFITKSSSFSYCSFMVHIFIYKLPQLFYNYEANN